MVRKELRNDKEVTVAHKSNQVDGLLNWLWYWQQILSREEKICVSTLADELAAVQLREDMKDTYKWVPDESRGFSMKGCYELLFGQTVASKISLFGWELLQDRLPSRVEL
ncbi:hypothetical protein TSUD_159500 [Trifolium subterraneum]|uniref:Reverse transcriptase zinc-binding domain-containing protein n=1 Tax=Trifolium subterraneum TaxID=3900 RepID=A0A2Z6MAJ4_TRISU|nr:hypothetical protein TSUD_159500 [Trifolium subterraneum]